MSSRDEELRGPSRPRLARTATLTTPNRLGSAAGRRSTKLDKDALALAGTPALARGQILADRYWLERELWRGAVGVVFRAYDSATETVSRSRSCGRKRRGGGAG